MASEQPPPIARVFWPSDCEDNSSGYLIGWNIRSFIGCVACVVNSQQIRDPQELEDALALVANDESLKEIHQYCSGPPIMLGLWNPPEQEETELGNEESDPALSLVKSFVDHKKQMNNFWITMSTRNPATAQCLTRSNRHEEYHFHRANISSASSMTRNSIPHLKELSCFGYQYVADSQVVLYRLPSQKHYFSCMPLNLDIFHSDHSEISNNINQSELEHTLRQVNCSLIIKREIRNAIKRIKEDSSLASQNDQTQPEEVVNQAETSENTILNQDANEIHNNLMNTFEKQRKDIGLLSLFAWYLVILISFVSKFAQSLWNKIFGLLPVQLVSILKNTATVQQLHIRLNCSKQLPLAWTGMHLKWKNHPQTRRFTVSYYNMFALITVDTILGILCAILISYYADDIVSIMNSASNFFTERIVVANIRWLMGWPAGFKLNSNVDSFMGQLFLFYSSKWTEILHTLPISYHTFVVLTSSTGVLGLSMMLSVVSDLLFICALHINWFYNGSARIYMHQLQAISGLWKLFRGKKRNVLRHRIDSCHYDIDQLLLGTIIFTVLFFLLPTVAIYYLYFSLVRSLVFFIHAVIFGCLQVLNHFPVLGVVQYLLDSSLFPGGIYFHLLGHSETVNSLSKQTSVYLSIKDQPNSFGCVFHYYKKWVSDFFNNNSLTNIISCALFGMPIQFNFLFDSALQ